MIFLSEKLQRGGEIVISRLVLILVTLIVVSCVQTNPEPTMRVCEPIRIELCRGLGYNETSMPNLVGHELQTDVDFTLQTFSPLIQYGCSTQLQLFLCAAYVPMCTPKVPVPIGPCRGLCETVRARCHPVLQGFGFLWPPALDCNRFPEENNHEHMCMEGPGEKDAIRREQWNDETMPPPTSKITSHKPTCQSLTKSHLYVRLNRSRRCTPLCEADILYDQNEKHLAEIWLTVWSTAALFTAIGAILCILLSDTKWDKILIPLVTCHTLVAAGWTVRWIAGRNPTACGYDPQLPGVSLLLTDGLSNAPCAATFLLRYYFGMAAGVWWSILCLKWHCAIRRSRSDNISDVTGGIGGTLPLTSKSTAVVITSNAQQTTVTTGGTSTSSDKKYKDTYSTITQLAAWGIPALQTIAVLVARLIDADELFGACFVGNQSDRALRILVAMPLFCYWIFGSVNLFAGYLVYSRKPAVTLGTIQHAPIIPASLNGMGTFLFICCVPKCLMLIAVFYEFANRDVWLNVPPPSLEPVYATKAPMWPLMMRAFIELLIGVLAYGWTLGPRITNLWKSKLTPTTGYKQPQPKFVPSPYSSASYQTVHCPQNSQVSISRMPRHGRKYPPSHSKRKPRSVGYKASSHTMSLTGNETVL